MKGRNMRKLLKDYAVITLGSMIFSLSFNWFFVPNAVGMGGVTGLAQVINLLLPILPVGVMTIVLNVPLFLLGWKYMGWHLLASSLYAMAVSSVTIDLLAAFHTFEPMDPMLASLCGGVLMGLGLGLVLIKGATTGGTEIVGKLLKLKFPWLPLGTLLLLPDFVVLALIAWAFGRVEPALYGLVSLFVATRTIDMVLYGMDTSKVAYVITDHWRAIADTLMKDLDRGVTLLHGEGAYTGAEKQVLLVAFKQREIVEIKQRIHGTDPKAFLIVCDAHDVLGEGFGDYRKQEI